MSVTGEFVARLTATRVAREEMEDKTFELWCFIGERLLHGQKQYGGFKFAEYDLDKMAAEELADLVVYLAAKRLLKAGELGPESP